MSYIVKDGTYENILINDGKQITFTVKNDDIKSPIKIIYPDGKIEIVHYDYDSGVGGSLIARLQQNLVELRVISTDIYQRIRKGTPLRYAQL